MDKNELLACINFFKELDVIETDVTTEAEKANHNKVVIVNYIYHDKSFTTNKLYYQNILYQENIRNPDAIINYFGSDVYWLDNEKHNWAKGRGEAELEKIIIDDMVEADNLEFKSLLKSIANNNKTGFIQRITSEGKTAQYHHNFENNNHWHDIILLIKEMINNNGEKVDKKFFSRLVFKWDGDKNTDRERSSLAKEVEWKSRAFIDNLYNNLKSIQNTMVKMDIINILKHKGQIILQGPPGTGKTYTAKDIAEQIIFSEVSENKTLQKVSLESSEQFKLIQFHPAYSYEDFVRGIVAESNGEKINYKTKNKILASFAYKAYENFINHTKAPDVLSKEAWFKQELKNYITIVNDAIKKEDKYFLNKSKSYIFNITENKIFYYNENYFPNKTGFNISFTEFMGIFLSMPLDANYDTYKFQNHNNQYRTLLIPLLQDFKASIKEIPKSFEENIEENNLLKYVLIIDEINRANLPAVLGELIYALEYRGEKVESMYPIDDNNTLIIPPNLYIIGTMNTSDRSVGHIDYAIRRRFAFIELLPKVLEGDSFELELFKQISALFIKNIDEYIQDNTVELKISEHLSEDFRPEDVWLGHSYFIKGEGDFSLRKKYEIVPILKEYIKDGILKQSAEPIINSL